MSSQLGTALITGASTGIGATYADRLARRGYNLVLVARDGRRLQTLAERLRAETAINVEVVKADLTDAADLNRVERHLSADQKLSMLVNNAGIGGPSFLGEAPDKIESLLRLNVVAATRLASAAAEAFVKRAGGTIINISSAAALAPDYFAAHYSGSKSYLLAFSQALHREVSESGVFVQVVMPGVVRTEIWERSNLDLSKFHPGTIMEAGEVVDAALAGLDQREAVTIPSLPNMADWDSFNAARLGLLPNLSHQYAPDRYKIGGNR
jgi:short-subunit dehydrogenase